MINPFTLLPFDEEVVRRVWEYSQLTIRAQMVSLTELVQDCQFQVPGYTRLGEILLSLPQRNLPQLKIDKLMRLSDLFTFDVVSHTTGDSVYAVDLSTPIRTLPAYHYLKLKSTYLSRRAHTLLREMYPRWVAFARQTNRPELLSFIPQVYHHPPPIPPDPSEEDYTTLRSLIQRTNGLAQLTLAVLQSIDPMRISAAQAHALEAMIDERFPNNRNTWVVDHLIYSRVVDKFNLRSHYGAEGYYYRDEYQPSNFALMVPQEKMIEAIQEM